MISTLPVIDYASHPAYGAGVEPDTRLGAKAHRDLQPQIDEMTRLTIERAGRLGGQYGARGRMGAELADQGVSLQNLSAASLARLQAAAAPVIETVQDRVRQARQSAERVSFKTTQEPFVRTTHGELWDGTVEALVELDLFETAATYFGAPLAKLKTAAVMVSTPDQAWSNNLYGDIQIETPPTVGFHIDSEGRCILKAVIYLNEVGPDQGPFGLVPGSNRWSQDGPERIYRRAFDKSNLVSRSDPTKRRAFSSLPRELQVKAEFGGDMLLDAPETRALVDQELVFTGPAGQANIFDPEAIHRGGNVRSGERHVLLVALAMRL